MAMSILMIGLAAVTQATAAPPSEELVQRFIAVLPDVGISEKIEREPDPQELERLTALNPGRDAQVRQVLEEKRACSSIAENASAIAVMRRTAHVMGAAKLERVIAFYQTDFPIFDAYTQRAERGETLSPTELAQLERIAAAYPLRELADAFQAQRATIGTDTVFTGAIRNCVSQAEAALARLQLKTR